MTFAVGAEQDILHPVGRPSHLFTDDLQVDSGIAFDNQFIMNMPDDKTMAKSFHSVAENVAADGLDDILHEFRSVGFNAFPLLRTSKIEANAGKIGTCSVELKTFLIGAQDNQIRSIQRLLNALGYKDQNKNALEVDGELGEKTAFAITQFQKAQGMQNINFGTVAGLTWKLLLNSL